MLPQIGVFHGDGVVVLALLLVVEMLPVELRQPQVHATAALHIGLLVQQLYGPVHPLLLEQETPFVTRDI